jgi:uncharacterized BrkB/YihY/UPF0761 family membrane protein
LGDEAGSASDIVVGVRPPLRDGSRSAIALSTSKRWPATAKNIVENAQARVERERERRYTVALAFSIANRGRRTAASVLAGALAFRFFLTLLPLTLVAVVGLGYLRSAGGTPSDALKQFGIKGVIASTINHSASFSDPGRVTVLLLGIVGLLSGARTCAATLRAIHALAWGIPVSRWRRGGRAGVVFLGAVVVGFACAGLAARARAETGVVLGFGASLLLAGVVGLVWFGASFLLPHPDQARWTAFLPGAVIVGVGMALLQAVTANWVGPKLSHESSLYGSLGVSFVVLGWLYVLGRLLVAAPLFNAAVLEHRDRAFAAARHGAGGGRSAEAGDQTESTSAGISQSST